MIRYLAFTFAAGLSLLAQGSKVSPAAVANAPNSSAYGSSVYFAGQPAESDLAAYAKLGVKTVVNLRSAQEMEKVGYDEAAAASKAGMKYIHVPTGGTAPSDAELAKIFLALDQSDSAKVLMHCASSNRVGMVWSIYRGIKQGLSEEDAIAEGKAAGLKAPGLEKAAREKIEASKRK